MEFNLNGNNLTIYLGERLDTANADEKEKEINEIVSGNAFTSLTLDLSDTVYVSSAGLRVVLRLKKNQPSLVVTNVQSEVYEVFEMTGFTEIMEVKKAFKSVSVEGCEVIGRGANGLVYRLTPDTIVKVYKSPDSMEDIQRERMLAKKAFVLGIPTAISYDIVKVGEGYGTVFELLDAKSLAKALASDEKNIDVYVKHFIDLLKKIHSIEVNDEDIPDKRELMIAHAKVAASELDEESGKKLVRLFEEIPENHHLMHGDYHLKNVMLQNGEALLIDMDTLSVGDPVYELGSMYNAFLGFSALDHNIIKDFMGITHEVAAEFWKKSLIAYVGTDDEGKIAEVEKKAKIAGYTRLLRRLINRNLLETEQGGKEAEFYKNELTALLKEVDKLSV